MKIYEKVQLIQLNDCGEALATSVDSDRHFQLEVKHGEQSFTVVLSHQPGQVAYQFCLTPQSEFCRAGKLALVLNLNNVAVKVKFENEKDAEGFHSLIKGLRISSQGTSPVVNGAQRENGGGADVRMSESNGAASSLELASEAENVFDARTEQSSAVQYFQFYGYLSQQQNMMQDFIRTSTYQRAMLSNLPDFNNKVVVDIGAGSGILSFFAIQAGARKVYAIEASSIAEQCAELVRNNNLADKITVIAGKVEEVNVPELADVLISEPMGYMLFNERMLESYLHAKKFLKPNGKMFPTQGDLFVAPFNDECLYQEQFSKSHFWYQPNFYGVDLSSLRDTAITEYFRQPIVDTFDYQILLAAPVKHQTNFATSNESDLHNISVPLRFVVCQTGQVHGLAFWFDVAFIGSKQTTWLSTAPTEALTHWYQVRCLLRCPIFAKEGEILTGHVNLVANSKQSYDVDILLRNTSTNFESTNFLDLKNPLFRYTGQPPQPPPGAQTLNQSPTETFWGSLNHTSTTSNGGISSGPIAMQNGYGDSMSMMNMPGNYGVMPSQNSGARQSRNFDGVNNQSVITQQQGNLSNNYGVVSPRAVTTQGITSGVAGLNMNTRPMSQTLVNHSPGTGTVASTSGTAAATTMQFGGGAPSQFDYLGGYNMAQPFVQPHGVNSSHTVNMQSGNAPNSATSPTHMGLIHNAAAH